VGQPTEQSMTSEDEQKAFKASQERTLVSISAELHKKLKVMAVSTSTSIYVLADEAITKYLKGK